MRRTFLFFALALFLAAPCTAGAESLATGTSAVEKECTLDSAGKIRLPCRAIGQVRSEIDRQIAAERVRLTQELTDQKGNSQVAWVLTIISSVVIVAVLIAFANEYRSRRKQRKLVKKLAGQA